MALKQTVWKIRDFEKQKFVTFGLDYKGLLTQIKGTAKKFRTIGKFEKCGVQKIWGTNELHWELRNNEKILWNERDIILYELVLGRHDFFMFLWLFWK